MAASDGRHDFQLGAARGGQPPEPAAFRADSANQVLSRLERYVASLQPGGSAVGVNAAPPGWPAVRGLRRGSLAPAADLTRRVDSPLLPLVASRHSDLMPRLRRRLVGSDGIRPLHIVAAPTAVVAVAIALTLRDGTPRTGFVLGVLLGVAVRVLA